MYGTVPYVLALAWVEVPYILTQTALFVPVAYFMVPSHLIVYLVGLALNGQVATSC